MWTSTHTGVFVADTTANTVIFMLTATIAYFIGALAGDFIANFAQTLAVSPKLSATSRAKTYHALIPRTSAGTAGASAPYLIADITTVAGTLANRVVAVHTVSATRVFAAFTATIAGVFVADRATKADDFTARGATNAMFSQSVTIIAIFAYTDKLLALIATNAAFHQQFTFATYSQGVICHIKRNHFNNSPKTFR
jgi:hypothetical protein